MTHEAVVVDTTVFSTVLSGGSIADHHRSALEGRPLVVSFQTVAELRYGALKAGWGPARVEQMERRVARALVVPPHDQLATAWAELRAACHRSGHGFVNKEHAADLWIAATARLIDAPLVTADGGFRGLPGVDVVFSGDEPASST